MHPDMFGQKVHVKNADVVGLAVMQSDVLMIPTLFKFMMTKTVRNFLI